MNKKKLIIISISIFVVVMIIGVSYAMYGKSILGTKDTKVIAGDIYMRYINGETKAISMIPSDTYNEGDYYEFTISGKNTSNKDIVYDIVLNHGDDLSSPKIRLDDKYLRFRLVTVDNNVETLVDTADQYPDITNKKLYVGTIPNTESFSVTYRLYVWVNGVIVGNVPNANYSETDWSNVYANLKVDVNGDFSDKQIDLGIMKAEKLKEIYKLGSTSGLVAINNEGGLYTSSNLVEEPREYRYSGVDSRWGGDVNNYIWFNNEMWRIVGIFKGDTDDGANAWNIKIVRDYPIGSYNGTNDAIQVPSSYISDGAGTKTLASGTYNITASGSYPAFIAQRVYWNSGGTNSSYAYPSKSGILLWLNENRCDTSSRCSWYYQNYDENSGINKAYEEYIATTNFYTKAGNYNTTVANEYNLERTTGTVYNSEPTYTGKIGMLYASDYAYASYYTIWNGKTTTMYNYGSTGGLSSNKLNNWMLKPNDSSGYYWFISPSSGGSHYALNWYDSGYVNSNYVTNIHGLRPVLNLKSSAAIVAGTGTYYDPYMIESNKYAIVYDLNGGTVSSANPSYYTNSTGNITLNNPTRTGYTFAGWTGSNGNTPQTSVTVNTSGLSENLHYIANWTPNTYTLTLNKGTSTGAVDGTTSLTATYDSSTISPSTITLASNPTTYTISGFGLDSSRKSNGATVSSTSTLTSRFNLQGYYSSTSGGYKVLNVNTTATYYNSSGYVTNGNWTRASDTTLYAQFTQNSVTLPTITKAGYTCGWTDSSNGTTITYASGYTLTPTANKTLYGLCILNEITINSFTVKNVYVGKTKQVSLNYTGEYETISYASSNTSVATINSTTGLITGVSLGTVSFTVTMTDYEGHVSTATISNVEVTNAPPGYSAEDLISELYPSTAAGRTSGLVAINTDGGLYTGTGTIREYRYSGVDSRWSDAEGTVKNYIWFNNEMWRIVGIFKGDTGTIQKVNDVDTFVADDAWNIKIVRDYPIGSYNGTNDAIQVPSSYISDGGGTKTLVGGTYNITVSDPYPAFTAQKVYWNYGGTNSGRAYPSESGILLWLNENRCDTSSKCSWYYLNYDENSGINKAYEEYIATTKFYTRAGNYSTTVANEYNLERTTGTVYNSESTYTGKIGMLYASDYAYASYYTIWNGKTTTMSNYSSTGGLSSNKLNNWMLKPNDSSGSYWFISPSSNSSSSALRWLYSGNVYGNSVSNSYYGLRPVLNLKSDTLLDVSGDGSYDNPYTIYGT